MLFHRPLLNLWVMMVPGANVDLLDDQEDREAKRLLTDFLGGSDDRRLELERFGLTLGGLISRGARSGKRSTMIAAGRIAYLEKVDFSSIHVRIDQKKWSIRYGRNPQLLRAVLTTDEEFYLWSDESAVEIKQSWEGQYPPLFGKSQEQTKTA